MSDLYIGCESSKHFHEFIEQEAFLPVKAFVHGINQADLHWHQHMEFLMAMEGAVRVKAGTDEHFLNPGDFVLINSNQIHGVYKTEGPNLLLALQINPSFFVPIYPHWNSIYFYCHSFFKGDTFDRPNRAVTKYLARIVWEMSRRQPGYRSRIGSNLYLLAYQLFNYPYHRLEEAADKVTDEDLMRLRAVVDCINDNLHRRITLKDVGKEVHLSYHYLSRFIQDKLGVSFQTYLDQLRLQRATGLLLSTDNSIKEIAGEVGFISAAAFHRFFKKEFNMTPGEYRKTAFSRHIVFNPQSSEWAAGNDAPTGEGYDRMDRSRTYLDIDRRAALTTIFAYLDPEDEAGGDEVAGLPSDSLPPQYVSLAFDAGKKGEPNCFYWRRLTSFTKANEGLRQGWQEQLHQLQSEIGFEQVRFHGLFADEMMIHQTDPAGNVSYNWTYVDNLFDSLLKAGLKPFVELGFMPRALRRSDETVFWWQANIAPPKDINLWTALVKAFVRHCVNRYGPDEVAGWYFEVWNEPELQNVFWVSSREEYFEFYCATVRAVKAISPLSPVGGPAITHEAVAGSRLKEFLAYCRNNQMPLDFVSLHIYPERFPEDFNGDLPALDDPDPSSGLDLIYHGPDHTYRVLQSARALIEETLGRMPEICISEWNASAFSRNLIHDTAYVAAFIIHHVVRCRGLADMLGYWTFTDINEENPLGVGHFHGNSGLINKDGIKKASYFAYYLLAKLGDEVLDQGDGYIVTKSSVGVQVLLYNYAYFDPLFLKGDTSLLAVADRYRVFENKPEKWVTVTVNGLDGPYKTTRYRLNRAHGSAYDLWARMGAPEQMSAEEIRYLRNNCYPEMRVENRVLSGRYHDKAVLPVHGVELILLQKQYQGEGARR